MVSLADGEAGRYISRQSDSDSPAGWDAFEPGDRAIEPAAEVAGTIDAALADGPDDDPATSGDWLVYLDRVARRMADGDDTSVRGAYDDDDRSDDQTDEGEDGSDSGDWLIDLKRTPRS